MLRLGCCNRSQATGGGTSLPAPIQAGIAQRLSTMATAEKSTVVRAQIHGVQRLQRQQTAGDTDHVDSKPMEL